MSKKDEITNKITDYLEEIEALIQRDNQDEMTGYVMNNVAKAEKEDIHAGLKLALIGLMLEKS